MRGLEELLFQVHSEERISEIMLQIKKKKQIGEAIKAYGQKRKLRKKKRVLNYQHRRFS